MNKVSFSLLSLILAWMPSASLLPTGHNSVPLKRGSIATARSPARTFPAGTPDDKEGTLKVEIKVDDIYIKKVLGTKVGELFASQLETDDPACRAAAVLVSQEAVNNYAYGTTLIDLLKETAKGIELGGKLSGAKTVTKAGQLSVTIAEALEDEEPAAALGRAMITEATDWLAGKSKTDIKKEADGAKDAMIKALFPGEKKKAKTFDTTVGACTVHVTPELQWPTGKTKQDLGGIWLHISGDCGCKKPLQLNSKYSIPTTFHGQTPDIKNCGLGPFQLNAFLPMKKLETSVSYAGNAINLADFGTKAKNLKEAIEKALKGEKSDKSPADIAKDLQKLSDKATTVEPTLILKPVFEDQLNPKDLYAKCNACPQTDTTTTGGVTETAPSEKPINVPDAVCGPAGSRCGALYNAWISLQSAAIATLKERKTDEQIAKELVAAQLQMNEAKKNLDEANTKLAETKAKLEAIQAEANRKGVKPSDFPNWTSYQKEKTNRTAEVASRKVLLDQKSKEVAKLQALADYSGKTSAEKQRMSDEAKAAYYECAKCCWSEARLGSPKTSVPEDVQAWEKKHPNDCGGKAYYVRSYQVDDIARIWVNGTLFYTSRQYNEDSGWLEITVLLRKGENKVRFQLENDRQGYVYGFQVKENDKIIFDKHCGTPGHGCNNDDQKLGIVYDETITIVR